MSHRVDSTEVPLSLRDVRERADEIERLLAMARTRPVRWVYRIEHRGETGAEHAMVGGWRRALRAAGDAITIEIPPGISPMEVARRLTEAIAWLQAEPQQLDLETARRAGAADDPDLPF